MCCNGIVNPISNILTPGVLDTLNKSQRHGCFIMYITFYFQDGHHMVDLSYDLPIFKNGRSYKYDLQQNYDLNDDVVDILRYHYQNHTETSIELD